MNNRRKFVSVAALAVAAVTIGRLPGQSLDSDQSSAERDVFKLISKYGSRQSVKRSPESAGTVAIKARIHNLEAFAETFAGTRCHRFDKIHAAGNTLSFRHKGIEFRLENLA